MEVEARIVRRVGLVVDGHAGIHHDPDLEALTNERMD